MSSTWVAAINIITTTNHSALGIKVGGKLFLLSDRHQVALRNRFSGVRLLIIDEISMLSSALFLQEVSCLGFVKD